MISIAFVVWFVGGGFGHAHSQITSLLTVVTVFVHGPGRVQYLGVQSKPFAVLLAKHFPSPLTTSQRTGVGGGMTGFTGTEVTGLS
jgi:hypothetical protein